jgi:transcriptional regulator with XRE-family HTH domain
VGAFVRDGAVNGFIQPRVKIHGPTLAALMAKHGFSAAGLGARAGLSASAVRMFRGGQRKTTYARTAQRLADALGEPVRAFATPYAGEQSTETGANDE